MTLNDPQGLADCVPERDTVALTLSDVDPHTLTLPLPVGDAETVDERLKEGLVDPLCVTVPLREIDGLALRLGDTVLDAELHSVARADSEVVPHRDALREAVADAVRDAAVLTLKHTEIDPVALGQMEAEGDNDVVELAVGHAEGLGVDETLSDVVDDTDKLGVVELVSDKHCVTVAVVAALKEPLSEPVTLAARVGPAWPEYSGDADTE